ncbi:MAG: alpha/beta fold hydrolase [Aquidulcibacter sp.]|uniref:alpha/beta fold hydrolase n=1 Tax=Aquidulcibacter sp. TaxID=2052990 RepID=UPI0022BDB993|nr:alpha/beta fold hydrolase [Aquidulcibacter sp.]MCE2891304.1 alpha/beta fold hydrolase [Hyphomonadaceae bacterium]MCZ8210109.1 alpha/beta fold hydrolase [Aquidulcibacter sp.]
MTRGFLLVTAMLSGTFAAGSAFAGQSAASQSTAELTRRAALGVALENTSDGPKVTTVTPQLTAALAGVEPGDIILSLNGKVTKTSSELVAAAGLLRAGDMATLTIQRGTGTKTVTAKATARPLESIPSADVRYGTVAFKDGRLRDILVTPKDAAPGAPVVFLIQGYGCGSVEGPPTHPYHLLAKTLAEAGIGSYRIEKLGMGDSLTNTPCLKTDFALEMEGFESAYQALIKDRGISPDRIIILGHSMGGIQAPLVAAKGPAPRGVMVYGTALRNWQDYMQELFAMQGFLSAGADPAEAEQAAKAFRPLMQRVFNEDVSLKTIASENPNHEAMLRSAFDWDGDDLILGRNLAYWRGVAAQDTVAAWRDTKAPVLAVYGEADFAAIDERDHKRIVDVVNFYRPGTATYRFLPLTGHGFDIQASRDAVRAANQAGKPVTVAPYNPELTKMMAAWINELPAKAK